MPLNKPVKIFISYSNNSKDRRLLNELKKYLNSAFNASIWDDGMIAPGHIWDEDIKRKLSEADIVLLLISVDFNNSDYINSTELPIAFKRREMGECEIVPIYLRECPFKMQKYSSFGMIPSMLDINKHLEPITSKKWNNKEQAFTAVVKQLAQTIELVHQTPVKEELHDSFNGYWDQFFTKYPPVITKKSLLLTVDCDRQNQYKKKLRGHFDNNHNHLQHLVYFISACNTQKPESLAKRLIYEYNKDTKDAPFFTVPNCNEQGEINVIDIEFGVSPEVSWVYFKNEIEDKIIGAKSHFENLKKKECLKKIKKIAFVFRVVERNWNSHDVDCHLKYILEKIAQIHEKNRKFVLFFIFNFLNVHNSRADECRCMLNALDTTFDQCRELSMEYSVFHIKDLDRVSKNDIKIWAEERIDRKNISNVFLALEKKNDSPAQDQNEFDMEIVEEMQYAAYTYSRDNI